MLGALLAVFVLGAFSLSVVLLVVVNVKQEPPPAPPIYKPAPDYRVGGDAL